jgi:hypothetical protein
MPRPLLAKNDKNAWIVRLILMSSNTLVSQTQKIRTVRCVAGGKCDTGMRHNQLGPHRGPSQRAYSSERPLALMLRRQALSSGGLLILPDASLSCAREVA